MYGMVNDYDWFSVQVFGYVKYPTLRENALEVIRAMFLGYRHSPLIFHKVSF